MAKVTMSLDGFSALQKMITEAPEQVREDTEQAVLLTTFSCAARARAIVPVKTGRLKRAIQARARGLNGRIVIDDTAPYWKKIEYGYFDQPAQPYLRPAAEAESPHYLERIRDVGIKLERAWSRVK